MQLSVIIVNYNVKYFLEYCLLSVLRASVGLEVEIFVVDNQSKDGSVEMLKEKFPQVYLIANEQNTGFAKANNQAVALARGVYILYLNPDTIVSEDCFQKCIQYLDEHTDVGALGCKMIDGQGLFLPESKRGFPSVRVAFFKILGLSSLFKKSKFFNGYHLGFLSPNETNEVDVLAGCFMFCRKGVIDKVGSFDEQYFMYGEDIDLSYNIKKGGYKNVYFADTSIIHYKGESTKKGSLNYVKMFYQAMIIFAKKHFTGSKKNMYVFLIQIAIYVRAVLAYFTHLLSLVKMPLIDGILLLSSLILMKYLWIKNIKIDTHYSSNLLITFFSTYILIWLGSLYFNGAYDKPYKPIRVMRGMLIGAMITLALYGLLNEEIRFSRGITTLGAVVGLLLILLSRKIMQWLGVKNVMEETSNHRVIIVGTEEETEEVKMILSRAGVQKEIIGSVSPINENTPSGIGVFKNIQPLIELYRIKEIIFVQQHLGFQQIIEAMQKCGNKLEYKIHSLGTESIIGSNSKNTAGDLYTTEFFYQITTPHSIRNKRFVDILFSLFFLLLSPILIGFMKSKFTIFPNLFLVLIGKKTFVGYQQTNLPPTNPYLLNVALKLHNYIPTEKDFEQLNWHYAKNYDAWDDVKIIINKWKEIE